MTPQDLQLIDTKIDLKIADLRGDVRLNTAALNNLKDRFEDFADRLNDVPTDLATLVERVSHLPTKEYLVRFGVGMLAVIAALITFGEKLQHLVK